MDKDFRHPGGTEPMEIYNRTSRQDVRDILTNSYHMRGNKNITNLPDTKIKFSSNGFHSQIKKVFSKQNIVTPTFVYIMDTLKILFWVCWALILHPFLIRNNLDTRLTSFILGILRTYIAITILHPISHYSHCLNSTLRSYYYILLSTITGVSCYWWRLEHIENHHIFSVGQISKDQPDESGYPMYRTHKAQIRRWHHRYQWIYAVIMYSLSAAILVPSQFVFVFNQKELSMNRKVKEILPLIVSFMINHLYFDFTSNVLHLVPVGLYFTLSQLVNHRMPTVVDYVYKTKQHQRLTGEAIDWAEYQISSAVDFSVDSWFWNEVTGGLNHQATHHLFPMIHYVHYPKLRKVLMEYFPKEKTTKYKHWWEALQVHMKLLYDFSE